MCAYVYKLVLINIFTKRTHVYNTKWIYTYIPTYNYTYIVIGIDFILLYYTQHTNIHTYLMIYSIYK